MFRFPADRFRKTEQKMKQEIYDIASAFITDKDQLHYLLGGSGDALAAFLKF